jgi:arylsulfatase A-like enzyme
VARPNFLFIMADDLGYADLGCFGAREDGAPVSPTLDGLAAVGMRFTDSYANSPVCSPTRFALMTGRWQYRLRGGSEEPLTVQRSGDARIGLPPSHPTLASLLRGTGYATALVGKWHLGHPPDFGPRQSGYQHFYGVLSGAVDYFSHLNPAGHHDLWCNDERIRCNGHLTDLLSAEAVRFIEQLRRGQPFLLSLHFTAPHWPWETRTDSAESMRIGHRIRHTDGGSMEVYRQMVREMDEGIADVLEALHRCGHADDTLVVFTSDNGGERFSDTWPFLGQKMDLLEGGLRVPTIARWPGRMAAGTTCSTPIMTMDWMPTLLSAAGVEPDPEFPPDGVDLTPLLVDPKWYPPRDLFWRTTHRRQRAVRSGRWKYLQVDGIDYLFDLGRDQRERANLVERDPERLRDMRERWEQWSASLPSIDPDSGVSLGFTEKELPRPTH